MIARGQPRRWPNSKKKDGGAVKTGEGTFRYRCYRCKTIGHKASECREPLPEQEDNTGGADSAGAADSVGLYAPVAQYVAQTFRAEGNDSTAGWCLDSGCTSHLCGNAGDFTNLVETARGKINLANNMSTEIKARGNVSIAASVNGRVTNVDINDALYVPDLRSNLLSVGKITDRGYIVIFDDKSARVMSADGRTVLSADRTDGLYVLREYKQTCGAVENPNGAAVSALSATEMWHRRMGHLNFHDLFEGNRSGAVRGMKLDDK